MQITMIGHSSVLIETQGKRILTDPFFNERGNLAYKRLAPPARSREELADVDLVFVSHGHFDHIDPRFLRSLPKKTPILTHRRAPFLLSRLGENVQKLETWRPYPFGDVVITPVPAVHLAPTNGFLLESEGLGVYFAADTYFHSFMTTVRQKFRIHVALLPVTTFRIPMTMGEQQALRAVQTLEPDIVIPIHLGIQPRSPLLRTSQSPERFQERLAQSDSRTKVITLREGMTWHSSTTTN